MIRFSLRALALATACISAAAVTPLALASSHREAPFISSMPKVDGTDFYMFRSYEPGREAYVTLIANYSPLQDAYGGPNYFTLDSDALYEIHVDNNGDAQEDLTFQLRFKNNLKDITVPVGGKNVSIALRNQPGVIDGVNSALSNVRETYTVDVVRGDRRTGSRTGITNAANGSAVFDKPLDNIGDKTFGGAGKYAAYAAKHLYDIKIPGCANGRMFVGQRKEPFAVDLGKVFDNINLNPIGSPSAGTNIIDDKNITSMILEVPISCLATGNDPVIGAWTTSSVRQARLVSASAKPGFGSGASLNGGAWVQISRLGMPLVNEVVIGLKDKDRFNGSKPKQDGQFADYVTNPAYPALIQTLFPIAPAPTNFPRTDLVAAFLTGVAGVNQPKNVTASEMLRLNTSIAPTPKTAQSNLGVLGNDLAGFPNGRRPGDDVVDATLRVAMGVLCVATGPNDALKVGCKPSDAPAGSAPFTDGALQEAAQFDAAFPYLTTPLPGNTAK